MRAVRIHRYGGPECLSLEQIDKPRIGNDEVLLRIRSAAVNPVDWKIREGLLKDFIPYELPVTLGWDAAGIIEAVGAGVQDFAPGDEVYTRPDIRRNGTYADYLAVRAEEIASKPANLDFMQAAAIPLAGITAWQSLVDVGKIGPGQRVLIHAGAGGVGHLAIQIAKSKGAEVVATASAVNQALLRELGVDEAIDYTKAPFWKQTDPVDLVFDTLGGEVQHQSWQLVRPGGLLVSVVDQPDQTEARRCEVRSAFVFIEPSRRILEELAALAEASQLKPYIEHYFTLSNIVEAQMLSQSGRTRGKIVINVS